MYAKVINDKHEDVMAKFGAIIAQGILSSPCQRQRELLPSLGICCPSSVNFSHFKLLL
jgi:hypothetical protein